MTKKSNIKKDRLLSDRKVESISDAPSQTAPILSFTYTPKQSVDKSYSNLSHQDTTSAYTYVLSDVKQTTIITTALFFASVVLYFIIQNRIINLAFFGY